MSVAFSQDRYLVWDADNAQGLAAIFDRCLHGRLYGWDRPDAAIKGAWLINWRWSPELICHVPFCWEQVNGGAWTTIQTGSATSRAISGKGNGTYGYRAQACNVGGCGPWSATDATVVTHPPASAPTVSVPGSSTSGSYTVSWTGVSTATSYTLQEQINGGAWSTLQSSSATSRAVSGKGNGTYGYRAQACNVGGCGPWSATDSISVTRIPATPPTPSVSISGPSYKPMVTVTWSAMTYATSYQLEQTHPQDGVQMVYNGAGTSWSELVLADGTVKYRVRACSSAGCSAYSGYASVMLQSGSGGLAFAMTMETAPTVGQPAVEPSAVPKPQVVPEAVNPKDSGSLKLTTPASAPLALSQGGPSHG